MGTNISINQVFSGPGQEILGPISISDLSDREVDDERGLSLATAPAYVVRQIQDDGEVRHTFVLGQALGRRALMDLLYTLAPYKAHGPDRFARVLDNWQLHDRAKTSSGSENLLLQHASSLKLSWQVFSQHRELFIAVLRDQTESTRVVPVITWQTSPAGTRKWLFEPLDQAHFSDLDGFIPILGETGGLPRPLLDSLVGLVTIPYFLPGLHKNWQPWQPLIKSGKSNYIGPASVPVVALRHRRAILNSGFIHRVEALKFAV